VYSPAISLLWACAGRCGMACIRSLSPSQHVCGCGCAGGAGCCLSSPSLEAAGGSDSLAGLERDCAPGGTCWAVSWCHIVILGRWLVTYAQSYGANKHMSLDDSSSRVCVQTSVVLATYTAAPHHMAYCTSSNSALVSAYGRHVRCWAALSSSMCRTGALTAVGMHEQVWSDTVIPLAWREWHGSCLSIS
jgi:hypothetical protein